MNHQVRGGAGGHEAHEDPHRTKEDGGPDTSLDPEPSEEEVSDTHTR